MFSYYMGYWPVVKKVVKDSDVVLFVLDARMPEMSFNKELEKMVVKYGKEFVLVFNKIDLIPRRRLERLKRKFPDSFFVSGSKNIGMSRLKIGLLIRAKRNGILEPKIGVVGYPNTGKSSIINALAKSAKAKVSSSAGTTRNIQWIKAGSLKILDSPGVVPLEDREVSLGILGSKNPEKLKKPEKVVFNIIEMFVKSNINKLEEFYGIKVEKGEDVYEIMLKIGRRKQFLQKGGKVDENRTMFQIISDWQKGKLRI